jgi:MerR family transcriptional regulator/heat shock protein HspR
MDNQLNEQRSARSRRGVYSISVAAELSGIPVQSLRLYEQRGLLTPARTAGGTRRYSDDDLVRLQRIAELLSDGVNVAGIGQILHLQDRNTQLETHNTELRTANTRLKSDKARLASADRPAKTRKRRSQAEKGERQ